MLVDSHAHLETIDDLDNVLMQAKEAGVSKIITIGTSIEASRKCIEIAEKYSNAALQIYATCGIHPEDGKGDIEKFGSFDQCFKRLKQLASSSKKVVGVGETGLDYHLPGGQRPATSDQDKGLQRELFRRQVKLAAELALPLVVHCRNAWEEIFDLLSTVNRELRTELKGVFHSWTGDWEAAKKALALGFYISFSGIVTFGNGQEVAEVAKRMPLDRMLVETDAPFLSPEPYRGKTNQPKNVKITAEFIAKACNLPLDKLAQTTTGNAQALFSI